MISFGILISSILVKPLFLPSLSFFFFFVFFHLSTVEAFRSFYSAAAESCFPMLHSRLLCICSALLCNCLTFFAFRGFGHIVLYAHHPCTDPLLGPMTCSVTGQEEKEMREKKGREKPFSIGLGQDVNGARGCAISRDWGGYRVLHCLRLILFFVLANSGV